MGTSGPNANYLSSALRRSWQRLMRFAKRGRAGCTNLKNLRKQEQSQRIILRYLKLIIYIRLEIRTKILTPKVTRNLLLSITKNAVVPIPIQMIEPQIRQLPNQKVQFPLNFRDGSHVFKCIRTARMCVLP